MKDELRTLVTYNGDVAAWTTWVWAAATIGTNTMGRPEYDTKKHGPGPARSGGSVVFGPQLRPAVPARARHD
jgi:hypothetical protein